jgi:hypothetical protein
VLLIASQLLLPALAARAVRQRVGRYGPVLSVHVSAFPALQLLWEHGQSATVRTGALSMTSAQASDLLWSARGFDALDVSSASVLMGPTRVDALSMKKRGHSLQVLATLTPADVRAALPAGVQVQGLAAGAEGTLEVTLGGELFGISASVATLVQVSEGKLVAAPRGLSLGGLTQLTLFSDPHLYVNSATFTPLPGGGGGGQSWRLALRASQV